MNESVLARVLQCNDLPTLPEVLTKILEESDSVASNAERFAALLEQDHAITSRILRLANSAFYGLEREVVSVQRAVIVLGFITVRDLVLSTAIFDSLSRKKQFALDTEDFWLHSLGTARAAHLIARKYCPSASKEGCFTAGLLHDVGKYLLALTLESDYTAVALEAKARKCGLTEIERERLGITHSQVGAAVAQEWHLPPLLVEVIRFQENLAGYAGPYEREASVVSAADTIARMSGFGHGGDWDEPGFDPDLLAGLSFSKESAEDAANELVKHRAEIVRFFGLLKG